MTDLGGDADAPTVPPIGLVWVEAAGGVIGFEGTMPWHLPEDLAHFKAVTIGSPVVMGRKTWQSLPPRFRPLPGRRNIVITRQADWQAEGAEVAHSVSDAVALAAADPPAGAFETGERSVEHIWVIGGAGVFAAAIEDAERVEVTEINAAFEGDTFAPAISSAWQVTNTDPTEGWHTSRLGLEYRFVSYGRSQQPAG